MNESSTITHSPHLFSSTTIILWLILTAIIFGIILLYRHIMINKIMNDSPRIKAIKHAYELSKFKEQTKFHLHIKVQKHFSQKNQFTKFKLNSWLETQLRQKTSVGTSISGYFEPILYNQKRYRDYFYPQIYEIKKNFDWSYKLPYAHHLEQLLWNQYATIYNDMESKKIYFEWEYTSPAGRNHYKNTGKLTARGFVKLRNKITPNKKHVQHNQHTTNDFIAKERAKLTKSLRYSILVRDNFTCQICGRTARDGVKLHVDHIKPLAKHGLTEPNNLRVLCEACNLGKGAKYKKA